MQAFRTTAADNMVIKSFLPLNVAPITLDCVPHYVSAGSTFRAENRNAAQSMPSLRRRLMSSHRFLYAADCD